MNPLDSPGRGAAVLLIEDDEDLAAMLTDALGAKQYRVWHVPSAADAELLLDEVKPDLIIVDLMLPDRNGLILCAELKARAGVPIIVCSGTKRKDDAVLALKLGADDFMAKPFSVDELQVRMEAALQRTASLATSPASRNVPLTEAAFQQIGSLSVDRAQRTAILAGQPLRLTPTEYRLLSAVAARHPEVVSREELADAIWGAHDHGIVFSLDVHMRRLRQKLRAIAPAPALVARRGFGYQLVQVGA